MSYFRFLAWLLSVPIFTTSLPAADAPPPTQAEVVVYGGTPAGVMAAVAAARQGHTVLLVDINNHIGGMVSGGLTATDTGDKPSIGGLSKEFFARIAKYYSDTYGANSVEEQRCHEGFHFEPHVAEKVYEDMVREQAPRITIWRGYRYKSTVVQDGKIVSLTADHPADHTSATFTGDIFIDASYEGDLMAGAKVPYRIGREARSEYNEYDAGVQFPLSERGQADERTMAYNFRMCLCSNPNNRVLFPKPDHYDPVGAREDKGKTAIKPGLTFAHLFASPTEEIEPGDKFDANWCDVIGITDGYPDGDWATRDRIAAQQRDFSMSVMYYLQNDPELPAAFRADAQNWGFAKDEFTDNGNFPFQFYVREARRMVGAYVMTERDISQDRSKPDGIGIGSYGVDCHGIRKVMVNGKEVVDATRHFACPDFDIPYASLIPKTNPTNLIVPVCLSSTHIAFDSIRLEPVWMMLGHAAGDAAHLALANKTSVQQVDPADLRAELLKEGAVLDLAYQPSVKVSWSPEKPMSGQPVHFTVTEDGTLKYPLQNIWWDFEGNGKVSAKGQEADATFPLEKTYNVHLLVEDSASHRRMVTCQVPVGAAPVRDVMVDCFDASVAGEWDADYPFMPGKIHRFADVFFGPAVYMDKIVHGKLRAASAVFEPKGLTPGRYQVCLGFRPAANHASNAPFTVTHEGQTTVLSVDQRTETTPFPLVVLGEFHCGAGGGDSVSIADGATDGVIAFDSVHWVWQGP